MILILTPFFPPNVGGVETHLSDYIDFLGRNKINATVLTYKPLTTRIRAPFFEIKQTVNIYRFPYIGFNLFYKLDPYPLIQFLYLFSGLFFYSLIFTLVYNKRIRIIHSHGFATALISGILGKIFKKKSIVSLHTIYKFSQKPTLAKVAKKILDSNIKILAISKGCKNDLLQIGIAKEKIIIYSYWINTSHFKPLEKSICRRKLGLSKSEFIALFVGRFTLEKQLLEALRVAQLTPKTTFLFIGQGPLSGKVKESEEKFNNISAIGKVDNLNLPLYYNSADVLLLGSVDEDYFGKTTMEALSSGLPVIISDRSCYFGQLKKIKSEILPENCGFIIKLDIQAISSKLHYLDQNRQELKLMKENCREFAIEHFSEKNAKIILQAYE